MRILHVYKDYPPVRGGIEHHLQTLAEEQAARGHTVTVLVTAPRDRAGERVERGVQVIRERRIAQVRSTPLSFGLVAAIRRARPDITHLHFPYPPAEVAQLLTGRSPRTVLTYHSDIVRQRWIGRLYRPLLRTILRRADRIIVSSPRYPVGSPVLAGLGDRITVVPYGIRVEDLSQLDPQFERSLRQRWPGHRLLFVGRLRYYKGIEYLIRAMESIPSDLVVVGDGPLRRRLQARADASPAGDRIHFVGEVVPQQLPAYYSAADLLVLPSVRRAEAFGIVQLEAMALGRPVVSTELGTGTSWVNVDGETGRVVPPGDPAALAGAINDLIAAPELRRQMGERARSRVAEHFTAARMAENVLAVYQSVLEGSFG